MKTPAKKTQANRRPLPLTPVADLAAASDDQYVDHRTVAQMAQVCTSTVWNYAKTDPTFPPAIHLTSRTRRYRMGDVRQWLRSKGAAA
jgi:predicted DNA-binding transcriptional regulator AlpA